MTRTRPAQKWRAKIVFFGQSFLDFTKHKARDIREIQVEGVFQGNPLQIMQFSAVEGRSIINQDFFGVGHKEPGIETFRAIGRSDGAAYKFHVLQVGLDIHII